MTAGLGKESARRKEARTRKNAVVDRLCNTEDVAARIPGRGKTLIQVILHCLLDIGAYDK